MRSWASQVPGSATCRVTTPTSRIYISDRFASTGAGSRHPTEARRCYCTAHSGLDSKGGEGAASSGKRGGKRCDFPPTTPQKVPKSVSGRGKPFLEMRHILPKFTRRAPGWGISPSRAATEHGRFCRRGLCAKVSSGRGPEVAEREGFEPSVDRWPTPVFKTGPFDRSGTSPLNRKFLFSNRLHQRPPPCFGGELAQRQPRRQAPPRADSGYSRVHYLRGTSPWHKPPA